MRVHVRLWCVVSAAAGSVAGKRGKLAASALLRAPLIRRCVFVCLCVCVCVSPPPLHWAALRASSYARALRMALRAHHTHGPVGVFQRGQALFFFALFLFRILSLSLSLSLLFLHIFLRERERAAESAVRTRRRCSSYFQFNCSLSLSLSRRFTYMYIQKPQTSWGGFKRPSSPWAPPSCNTSRRRIS